MTHFVKESNLFNSIGRMERWIIVEKTFIKFLCQRKGFSKSMINSVLLSCEVKPYECLQNLTNPDCEYLFFKKIFFSKSHIFEKDMSFAFGLDYQSLCCTANSLLLKQWHELLFKKLDVLKINLRQKSLDWMNIVQIGRTHGIYGEPTSFGYRFAVIYNDIERYIKTFFGMRNRLEVVSIDYGNLLDSEMSLDLHRFLSEELDLFMGSGNFKNMMGRNFFNLMASIGGFGHILSKHAEDISLLGEAGVDEVESSVKMKFTMSRIELKSREIEEYVQSYVNLFGSIYFQNDLHFKYSENCLYGALNGILSLVDDFSSLINDIAPNHKSLEANLYKAGEWIYSQKILLYLIQKTDKSREILSEDVKQLCPNHPFSKNNSFRFLLKASDYEKYFSDEVIEKLFDREAFLINLKEIYSKIFRYELKAKKLKKVLWTGDELLYLIDLMSDKLNSFYATSKTPVTVITFSERSLVFAGHLIKRLNFPISFMIIPHNRERSDIKQIVCERSLVHGKNILIIDFLVHRESRLDHFIDKLEEIGTPMDVKICSLLKFNDVTDEKFVVNWGIIDCDPDDFYAGFGKTCGSSEALRHLPMIGLAF